MVFYFKCLPCLGWQLAPTPCAWALCFAAFALASSKVGAQLGQLVHVPRPITALHQKNQLSAHVKQVPNQMNVLPAQTNQSIENLECEFCFLQPLPTLTKQASKSIPSGAQYVTSKNVFHIQVQLFTFLQPHPYNRN